ncbi:Helix-turn-helix domain-containing protein [Thermoactinomyces sp. DSM 45891]|uniref:helix-turn-helix domain-containing protein n=1 Tax=Thermoactinomyces sp. DSM 45891 TaxID=1761907 RepID=UPI000915F00A|nr:helix-turn-helix transcriptional regulator [Thermoactinomyces sp. DSM 45891]SFX75206.1 Helix-turn-helix domain-containing protein [Thermoactinomyces sp. DSM 45891]
MSKKPKTYKELTEFLDSIPGVKEHVDSFSKRMGRKILKRRNQLGLTQKKLADLVQKVTGKPMHQSTISEIEGGSAGTSADMYDRVLRVLGMTELEIQFSERLDAHDQDIEIHTSSIGF